MKILAHCYTYGYNSSSGADKMLQSLMEYLAARGCECKAVIDSCPQSYTLNSVFVASNKSLLGEAYDWCDVVIIHLVAHHEATKIAERFNKPVVHICHNDHTRPTSGHVVYNSAWLARQMNLPLPAITVHPPTKPVPRETSHAAAPYITLVNTNDNKGGLLFKQLAIAMLRYKFLGVHGGYDKNQLYQPVPNIMYRAYDAAGMNYDDTRIIIVPSKTESWSLVAAEAMARGIPIICSDLPGLRENCGDAAIYAGSVLEYMNAIVAIDMNYEHYRHEVLHRFALHNYNEELNSFYNFIENIAGMKEKKEVKPVPLDKEKKEIKPVKEKRERQKP